MTFSEGTALETLFLQELRAINDYLDYGYQLYYWRNKTGVEVDFIAYGEQGLNAFEIKRSAQVSTKDCAGLKAFKEEYAGAKLWLVYHGNKRLYFGDVQVIPYVECLQSFPEILRLQ